MIEGRQIGVILYPKSDLHGLTVTADELPIEDILTVKHHGVPLDGADMFQQGEIESIGTRIALTEDREISDPVGDLGQDQQ